jgi:rubrerythrin
MVELKLLNNTQKEQLTNLLTFYKHIYVCNRCGTVYGSDFIERKDRHCPNCEEELKKEERKQ